MNIAGRIAIQTPGFNDDASNPRNERTDPNSEQVVKAEHACLEFSASALVQRLCNVFDTILCGAIATALLEPGAQ